MLSTKTTKHNFLTSADPRKFLRNDQSNRDPSLRHNFMERVFDPNLVKYKGPIYGKVNPKETFKEILDVADQNKHQYYLRHVLHVFEPSLGPKYAPKKIEGKYGDNEDHKLKMLALTAIPNFFDADKEIFRKAILHLKQTTKSDEENSIIDDNLAEKHFIECLCASSQVSTGKKISDVSFIHDHKEQKILDQYKRGDFSDPARPLGWLGVGDNAAQELIKLEQGPDDGKYMQRMDQLKKDKKCMVQYSDGWNTGQIGTVFGDGNTVGPTQTVQSDVVLTKVVSKEEEEEFCFRLDVFVDIITGMENGIKENNIEPFVKLAISKISSPVSSIQIEKLRKLIDQKMHIKNDAKWYEKQVSYNNALWVGECRLEKAIATLTSDQVNDKFKKFVNDLRGEKGAPTYPFKDENNKEIDQNEVEQTAEESKSAVKTPDKVQEKDKPQGGAGGGNFAFFSKSLNDQLNDSNKKIKLLTNQIKKNELYLAEIKKKIAESNGSTVDIERTLHAATVQLRELEKNLADENVTNKNIEFKKAIANKPPFFRRPNASANKKADEATSADAALTEANKKANAAKQALEEAKKDHEAKDEELFKKFKSEHKGLAELYYYSFLTQDDKYPVAPTLLRGPQCATKIVPTLMSGVYENIVQCDENGLIDAEEEFNFNSKKPIVNKFMHRRISEFGHFPHELEGDDHYLVEEIKLNELQIRELKKYPRKYDNKGTLEERPTDIFYPYPFEILISNITEKIEENKTLLQALENQKIQGDQIIKELYDFSKFQQPYLIPPNQSFISKGITIENSAQFIPHGMIFAGYDDNIPNVTDRMGRYLRAMKELVGQCLAVNVNNGRFLNEKKFETEFIQKINDNKDAFNERVWLLPGYGFVGEDTGERKDVKQWNPNAHCFDFEKYTYTYLPQSAGKRKTRKYKRRTHKKQKKNKKTTRHLKKRSRRNH